MGWEIITLQSVCDVHKCTHTERIHKTTHTVYIVLKVIQKHGSK